jgi:diguanylate cyclase (GGDEF)-like protein
MTPAADPLGLSLGRPAVLIALYALIALVVNLLVPSTTARNVVATALAALAATLAVAPAVWAATLEGERGRFRRWVINAAALLAIAAAELLTVFHTITRPGDPPPHSLLVLVGLGGLVGCAAVRFPVPGAYSGLRGRALIDAALAAAALVLVWITLAAQLPGVDQDSTTDWTLATVALVAPLAATGANALSALGVMAFRREAGLLAGGWLLLTVTAGGIAVAFLRSTPSMAWTGWLVPPAMACLAFAALEAMKAPEMVSAPIADHPPSQVPWPLRERGIASVAVPYLVFGAAVALAAVERTTAALTPMYVAIGLGIATLIVARQVLGARIEEQLADALERAQADLQRQATIDPVTELPNRRALMERLGQEVERALRYTDPLSVCFVDIDRFKNINDSHGHQAGDLVLREVGSLLRRSARAVDFVGRYGGEEFVIVLPETWSDDAMVMAERTRRLIHGHRFTLPDGGAIRLSISVGVAGLPEHASDLPTLLERADRALYAAKAGGRNRVVLYEPEQVSASHIP